MHIKFDFSHAVTPHNISLAAALGALTVVAVAAFWPNSNEPSYVPQVQNTVVADNQPVKPAPASDLN